MEEFRVGIHQPRIHLVLSLERFFFTIRIKREVKSSGSRMGNTCPEELFEDRPSKRQQSCSRLGTAPVLLRNFSVGSSGRVTFSRARPTTFGGKSRKLNRVVYQFRHGRTGSRNFG